MSQNNKIRVSLHNGKGKSKHNDRTFLKGISVDEAKEIAPHIDLSRIKDNYYWATSKSDFKIQEGASFKEIELSYYNKFYSKHLEDTNKKYIKNGHKERCKTMEEWYKSKQKKPIETILQIGDKNTDVDPAIFKQAVFDYCNFLTKKYGNNVKILDFAIHLDEESPHAHIRQVYHYKDKNVLKIGQNKALEQAGISLPNPNKSKSRYNNRKMTLDKELRKKWQDIAISYGFNVEKTPRIGMKHKSKEAFIESKIAEKTQELDKLNKISKVLEKNLNKYNVKKDDLQKIKIWKYNLINSDDFEHLKKENQELLSVNNILTTQNEVLQKDLDIKTKELDKIKDDPNRLLLKAREKARSIELSTKKAKEIAQIEANEIIISANEQYDKILEEAKITVDEQVSLRNFKKRIEKMEKMFPEEFKNIEKQYKEHKRFKDVNR